MKFCNDRLCKYWDVGRCAVDEGKENCRFNKIKKAPANIGTSGQHPTIQRDE